MSSMLGRQARRLTFLKTSSVWPRLLYSYTAEGLPSKCLPSARGSTMCTAQVPAFRIPQDVGQSNLACQAADQVMHGVVVVDGSETEPACPRCTIRTGLW